MATSNSTPIYTTLTDVTRKAPGNAPLTGSWLLMHKLSEINTLVWLGD
jgi:hypothetical protein